MEKMAKKAPVEVPRICQVLDVQPGELWRVQDDDAVYRISPGGMLEHRRTSDGEWRLSDVIHLTAVINQPDIIIRGPAWTPAEVVLLRQLHNVGVNWLSRDTEADVVDMWSEMPEIAAGGYKGTMIGSVPAGLIPSLDDGQCVKIS